MIIQKSQGGFMEQEKKKVGRKPEGQKYRYLNYNYTKEQRDEMDKTLRELQEKHHLTLAMTVYLRIMGKI